MKDNLKLDESENNEFVKFEDEQLNKKFSGKFRDAVVNIIIWVAVTAMVFAWSVFALLMASLVLINIWHVTFISIVKISAVVTIVFGIFYAVYLVRKHNS